MGIKWKDIHFGNSMLTNSIFIGKSKVMKNKPELSVWTDKSEDISNECMYAVACKLKQEQLEGGDGKGYSGYGYEDGSKLIWIAPNHDFKVTPKKEIENE